MLVSQNRRTVAKSNEETCPANFELLIEKERKKEIAREKDKKKSALIINEENVEAKHQISATFAAKFYDSLIDPIRNFLDQNKAEIDENNLHIVLRMAQSPVLQKEIILDYAKLITGFKNLYDIIKQINNPALAFILANQCEGLIKESKELKLILICLTKEDRFIFVEKHLDKITKVEKLASIAPLLNPVENVQLYAQKREIIKINPDDYTDNVVDLAWHLPPREACLFIINMGSDIFNTLMNPIDIFYNLLVRADCSETEYYSLLENYLQSKRAHFTNMQAGLIFLIDKKHVVEITKIILLNMKNSSLKREFFYPFIKEIPVESRKEFWECFFANKKIIDHNVNKVTSDEYQLLSDMTSKHCPWPVTDIDFMTIFIELSKKIKWSDVFKSSIQDLLLHFLPCFPQSVKVNCLYALYPVFAEHNIPIIHKAISARNNSESQEEKLNALVSDETYNLDLAKKYLTASISPDHALDIYLAFVDHHFFNAAERFPALQHLLSVRNYTDDKWFILAANLHMTGLENVPNDAARYNNNLTDILQRVRAIYLEKMDACIYALDTLKNVPHDLKNIILQYYDDNCDLSGLTHRGIQFSPKLMPPPARPETDAVLLAASSRLFQPSGTSMISKEVNTSSLSQKP